MSKILSNSDSIGAKIFPLIDHLYICQVLEYNSWDFLKWFLKNPLKRNLQRKHQLKWTRKTIILGSISIFLLVADSLITSFLLSGNFWWSLILLPIKSLYFPLFLIVAQIILLPFESYQKQKILIKASQRLSALKNLKVVAITGSFGKTSAKDILYTLIFKKYYVVKTPKSFNTPLGIAQTILEDVKENTQIFICEIGAYKRGEIAKIAKLLKPDLGIITAVTPQHLERFGSIENIAHTKFELVENLSHNGIAILNGESEWLRNLALHLEGVNVNYYGQGSEYFTSDIKVTNTGTSFIFHTPKGQTVISIPLIGEHHARNFLAAATAALQLGLTLSEVKERTKLLLPTPHRMEIKKIGDIILIDNSYNTNPISAESSLDLLASFEDSRKIVITPGFVELGDKAAETNRKFGEEIGCLADEVIIVGENAKKDLLDGIKKVWPDEPRYTTHLVESTQEGIALAQKLTNGVETVVLLENDLPDQYC